MKIEMPMRDVNDFNEAEYSDLRPTARFGLPGVPGLPGGFRGYRGYRGVPGVMGPCSNVIEPTEQISRSSTERSAFIAFALFNRSGHSRS